MPLMLFLAIVNGPELSYCCSPMTPPLILLSVIVPPLASAPTCMDSKELFMTFIEL